MYFFCINCWIYFHFECMNVDFLKNIQIIHSSYYQTYNIHQRYWRSQVSLQTFSQKKMSFCNDNLFSIRSMYMSFPNFSVGISNIQNYCWLHRIWKLALKWLSVGSNFISHYHHLHYHQNSCVYPQMSLAKSKRVKSFQSFVLSSHDIPKRKLDF